MLDLNQHPTVLRVRAVPVEAPPTVLETSWLRSIALAAGADDVGFVRLDRPELDDQRAEILRVMPRAKSLLSFVRRMQRENVRSPARSIANLEFHETGDEVNEIAREISRACEARGIAAINGAMGFPMEMDRWPTRTWVVSHKPVAAAAGLGHIGIHRNVIHPRFGSFVLLGTVILAAELDAEDRPVDFQPCLECKLCVAACPTGAIAPDGRFDFAACMNHNYREFMGGFVDWVETLADSPNRRAYREKVSDAETVSLWQSLSFGANYKAAYCLAACPAGEDVIRPFLEDRKGFVEQVVRPLQDKVETVYVVAGSDAEAHVAKRFPNKRTKQVGSGVRSSTLRGFLSGLPLFFQRGQAGDLAATYHFRFFGREEAEATVEIRDRKLTIRPGLLGKPDLTVTADAESWLRFLSRDLSLLSALLGRKIRISGPPRLLRAFARCFPS